MSDIEKEVENLDQKMDTEMEKLELKLETMFAKQDARIDKLCDNGIQLTKDIQLLSESQMICKMGCELPSYKVEMRGRCETFDTKIKANSKLFEAEQLGTELKIKGVEEKVTEKLTQHRSVIGRFITTAIIVGVCLVGVIGTIQVNKVDHVEYSNHLDYYTVDKLESQNRFNEFINTYNVDRNQRDVKIDNIFKEQLTFNREMVKQTSLLEKQLEVIKTRIEIQ
jgi:hypothetical protein